MKSYAYDLHIHSCLSPCGDEMMTPPNIANMAVLKELDLIAVCDHNTAGNCRAVVEAAKELPLTVIPGMEITTEEEIHMVCLFPDCDAAEAASAALHALLIPVQNQPEVFGRQLYMDSEEAVTGEEPLLLINATSLNYEQTPAFAERFGGFCYPAHIDRTSTSVLSTFGMLPESPFFPTVEVYAPEPFFSKPENLHYRDEHRIITSSDAHWLEKIAERERFLHLEQPTFAELRRVLTAR